MIFKIFKKDLKGLSRNILALAIALGLCLIPSLYAWFNIYSNWDPYANTASVQIAIVSEDEGYSESDDSTINMGEQIVEQLHSNDKLGWRFPETKDEAMNKLNAGKYYAVIVVGEDFSRSLYDFLDNGLNPPTVTYYENSKKNAVASKITDTGKSTLQNTINSEFIDVCVKTIMQGLNEIAENDPSIIEKTVKDLQSVSANINSYDTMIDMFIKSNSDLADNLAKLQEVLPQIKDVLTGTTDVLCRKDFRDFYYQNMDGIEIAGVSDYYGRWLFGDGYINSGVMLMNMRMIRQNGLLEKCREQCIRKEMFMPDQTAVNTFATRVNLCGRKFNDQRRLHDNTVFQHFTTTFLSLIHI